MNARLAVALTLAGSFLLAAAADDPPPPPKPPKRVEVKELPKVATDNTSALVKKYRDKLKFTSSTFWPGWPEEKAFDGNLETSWFTQRGDAAAKGTKPWIEVTFPEDVTVKRVTILGNREPAWLNGYTILAGAVELKDAQGKRLHYEDNEGVGNFRDFEFRMKDPVTKVRTVRFTSLGDQGDQNPYDDIAIAEMLIE